MLRTCLCVALLPAVAAGGTRDDGVPDERYVAEGSEWRHCVGEISGEVKPRERNKGSCVVFDPHHVLTAAHVIEGCRNMQVQMPDGAVHVVTMSAKCPDWTRDGIGYGDIAVCRVRERFRARRLPKPAATAPRPGPVVAAGYGFTGPMSTGSLSYDGKLRAGTNSIERLMDGAIICDAKQGGSRLEYHIESGDSGGPLFDIDGNIIGIHSSTLRDVGKSSSRYGDESVHTRVDRFHSWIEEVVNAPAE